MTEATRWVWEVGGVVRGPGGGAAGLLLPERTPRLTEEKDTFIAAPDEIKDLSSRWKSRPGISGGNVEASFLGGVWNWRRTPKAFCDGREDEAVGDKPKSKIRKSELSVVVKYCIWCWSGSQNS